MYERVHHSLATHLRPHQHICEFCAATNSSYHSILNMICSSEQAQCSYIIPSRATYTLVRDDRPRPHASEQMRRGTCLSTTWQPLMHSANAFIHVKLPVVLFGASRSRRSRMMTMSWRPKRQIRAHAVGVDPHCGGLCDRRRDELAC